MKKLSPVLAFLFLSLCAFAESAGQLATYTYNLEQGWNLIGLTLNPTAESEQEMLGHRIYEFNGDRTVKAYCQSGDLAAGRAYWIFSDQNESLVVRGTPVGDLVQDASEEGTGTYKLMVSPISYKDAGDAVTVTAPEKEGYSFTGWTVEGVSLPDTTQPTVTFTMPANNVLLGENYTINSYVLTVDGVPEERVYGTEVTVTAPEKEGYSFTGWTVEGVTVDDPTAATISFTMPANAVSLATNYSVNSYKLTTDGTEEQVNYGASVEKTAATKEGHAFTGWTITGVTVEDPAANPLFFTMPANAVTLATNYSVNSYKLTTDGTEEQVNYGASVEKTAATKEGHTFTGWTVEGVTVDDPTAATISFTMPANAVTLKTNYEEAQEGGTYLVVNLSDGSYSYTETAPDLTSDTCRTTELWLRKIPAGTFTMGSPADEWGRYDNETQHQVTLTQDYYIGVFEMTQRQYELITGQRPSYFNNASCYATRPVEKVSYNMIRGATANLGAGWPTYGHAVDSDSFLGKLRTKTGLAFDLPTEAQWEYACRAGTTTALNTGKNLTSTRQDAAMDEAGRYWDNGGSASSRSCDATAGTAKVGSYLPNAWGLYDMHGNVLEWCLDRYQDLGGSAATDPVGPSPTSGSHRVVRGGSWYNSYGVARDCRSAYRGISYPSGSGGEGGFRVAFVPSVQ